MKLYKVSLLFLFIGLFSCKKNFLDETPLDFLSSSTAFVTYADFNLAVNDLYRVNRVEFYTSDESSPFDYLYGCDIVFDGQPNITRHTNMPATYDATAAMASKHWIAFYRLIAQANVIISKAPGSNLTDIQKNIVVAKASFFRALAYRSLAYLYGGVPLELNAVSTPKTDYVRATKADVLNQCIIDLKFCIANLPAITAVQDGEVNTLAAGHLLAEVYMAAGQYQNAADAASVVISNPSVSLMKNRFGTRSTVATGNVYWDLFQPGNQNRKSGNLEGLWVIQFETDVTGGASVSTGQGGNYLLERNHAPNVGNIITTGNKSPFLAPVSDLTGGRGIGWAISSTYFSDSIWKSDFTNDIRNANINFARIFTSTNPASVFYGQPISTMSPPPGVTVPSRTFYAYQTKCTTPGLHPAALFSNPAIGLLKSTAGGTYLDQYFFRLAETYLLRSEAYLKLNNLASAAADLNSVRARSNASAVLPSNVTIDYILDERLRELGVEEKRMLTLMRMGLWYDRTSRLNPYYNDAAAKYNLWPIPQSEIERNIGAKLEQNPGYN